MMVKCNPNMGKYMSVSLMFRGDFVPKDIGPAICYI
jgi:hypothetical protein